MTATNPPFLFRAASDKRQQDPSQSHLRWSRGLNTETDIDPLHGYDAAYHTDLASIPTCKAAQMISDHIRYKYDSPSEFSSWSVSLLYVLVHAVRKYVLKEGGILIYVMNTSRLPASNGCSRADKLVHDLNLDWVPNASQYTVGEYLIHGKLSNSYGLWQAVDFDLVKEALWRLYPGLEPISDDRKQDRLFQRVLELRRGYFGPGPPNPLTNWKVGCIGKIAACFDPEWRTVVTIALIAFRRRNLGPKSSCYAFLEQQLRSGVLTRPNIDWTRQPILATIPEAHFFMRTLQVADNMKVSDPAVARATPQRMAELMSDLDEALSGIPIEAQPAYEEKYQAEFDDNGELIDTEAATYLLAEMYEVHDMVVAGIWQGCRPLKELRMDAKTRLRGKDLETGTAPRCDA